MSELKELVGGGNTTAFLGHTLSPPRLRDYADAEEECAAAYLRLVSRATLGLPDKAAEQCHQRVVDNLRKMPMQYGSQEFAFWALSRSALPFLAWLSFKQKEAMDLMTASSIVADATPEQVGAILDIWGFTVRKKPPAPQPSPQPTGGASSDSSASIQTAPDSATNPQPI